VTNQRPSTRSYKDSKLVQVRFCARKPTWSVELQLHPNDGFVPNSRRLFEDAAAIRRFTSFWPRCAFGNPDETSAIAAAFCHGMPPGSGRRRMPRGWRMPAPYVRAWRSLALEKGAAAGGCFQTWPKAKARILPCRPTYLASRRPFGCPLPPWVFSRACWTHAEDAQEDHNLPLMSWYGRRASWGVDLEKSSDARQNSPGLPILSFHGSRIASAGTPRPSALLVRAWPRKIPSPDHVSSRV